MSINISFLSSGGGTGRVQSIDYNQMRVRQGEAILIGAENFGEDESLKEYRERFKNLRTLNSNVKKDELHVSFSVKGNTIEHKDIAEQVKPWMDRMGYGKQPYLIYAHHNTDNNHVHVVSSRIDSKGKKIESHKEAIRGREIIEKQLGRNPLIEAKQFIVDAKGYKHTKFSEYLQVLKSKDFTVNKQSDGGYKLYRNGIQRGHITKPEIDTWEHFLAPDIKRGNQIAKNLGYTAQRSASFDQLKAILKNQQLDLQLRYRKSEKDPYAYTLIDHKHKQVFQGRYLVKMDKLNGIVNDPDSRKFSPTAERILIAEIKDNYKPTSIAQYKAIAQAAGYFTKNEGTGENINITFLKGNEPKVSIPKSQIQAFVDQNHKDRAEDQDRRAIPDSIRALIIANGKDQNIHQVRTMLQANQIDMLIYRKKGEKQIMNYQVIDHATGSVFSSQQLRFSKDQMQALETYSDRKTAFEKHIAEKSISQEPRQPKSIKAQSEQLKVDHGFRVNLKGEATEISTGEKYELPQKVTQEINLQHKLHLVESKLYASSPHREDGKRVSVELEYYKTRLGLTDEQTSELKPKTGRGADLAFQDKIINSQEPIDLIKLKGDTYVYSLQGASYIHTNVYSKQNAEEDRAKKATKSSFKAEARTAERITALSVYKDQLPDSQYKRVSSITKDLEKLQQYERLTFVSQQAKQAYKQTIGANDSQELLRAKIQIDQSNTAPEQSKPAAISQLIADYKDLPTGKENPNQDKYFFIPNQDEEESLIINPENGMVVSVGDLSDDQKEIVLDKEGYQNRQASQTTNLNIDLKASGATMHDEDMGPAKKKKKKKKKKDQGFQYDDYDY